MNWAGLSVCLSVSTEIKALADMDFESDGKLDKLESFLGKINNKGQSRQPGN